MRKKPKGRRFANLTARAGVIYYQRVLNGRRVRFSTETDDWELAATVKAAYEAETGAAPRLEAKAPTFGELCERYLREGADHLAPTTLDDRRRLLRPDGTIRGYFEDWPVESIQRADLVEWYAATVTGRGRSANSGRNDVVALASVFQYAADLELVDASPVDGFRRTLNRRGRSKSGRAGTAAADNAQPIERGDEVARFVAASRARGGLGHLLDLLMLDAGLRQGEAEALTWASVAWGRREDGLGAQLMVSESLSRGVHLGPPKSGRARRVALSKRLRGLLLTAYMERGRPDDDARILEGLSRRVYRRRHFRPVCDTAGLGHRRPKDLRDTFASQLLSAGVQLAYVSSQLGHGDVAVTAKHYARWTGGDEYTAPRIVGPDEVPADLLSRIEAESRHPNLTPAASGPIS